TDSFLGQDVASVIQITSCDALNSGQLNGGRQQPAALHPNANNSEPHTAGRVSKHGYGIKQNGLGGNGRAGSYGADSEKLSAGKFVALHGASGRLLFLRRLDRHF